MNAITATVICVLIAGIDVASTLGELSENHTELGELSILVSLSEMFVWLWATQKMREKEIMTKWLQRLTVGTYALFAISDMTEIVDFDLSFIIALIGLVCLLVKNIILMCKYRGALMVYSIVEIAYCVLSAIMYSFDVGVSQFAGQKAWVLVIVFQYEFLRRVLYEEEDDDE